MTRRGARCRCGAGFSHAHGYSGVVLLSRMTPRYRAAMELSGYKLSFPAK